MYSAISEYMSKFDIICRVSKTIFDSKHSIYRIELKSRSIPRLLPQITTWVLHIGPKISVYISENMSTFDISYTWYQVSKTIYVYHAHCSDCDYALPLQARRTARRRQRCSCPRTEPSSCPRQHPRFARLKTEPKAQHKTNRFFI